MTFEEIQKIIEGMLAVQREIQDKQLKFMESFSLVEERLEQTREVQERTDERLDRITEIQDRTDERLDRISIKMENLTENVSNLNIISQRHEDRLTQSYGYHQTAESDRLRLFEVQNRIERRLDRIERKLDAR